MASDTEVAADGSRLLYVTDELSRNLREVATGKAGDDPLLGCKSFQEFHADFRRMVRASRTRFDLSDIKELYKAAAGSDYALLKGYKSEEPHTLEDVKAAWLKVLPRLVVGA